MIIEYEDEVDAAFVYFNKSIAEARSEPANVELENAAIICSGAWTASCQASNCSAHRAFFPSSF
jgi:hypothetical protein